MGAAAAHHPVEAVRVMKQRGPLATACVADMQGWRGSHEDAHFMDQPDGGLGWASFGVLDGHGGQKAALLAADKLPIALKKATKGRKPIDGPGVGKLQKAYEEVDADLRKDMDDGKEPSGSTTISAGVKIQPDGKYSCYLANAGDSRGILVRLREPGCDGSKDHVSTSVNATLVMKKAKAFLGKDDPEDTTGDEPEKGTPVEEAGKLLQVLKIGKREFEVLPSIDNKPDRHDENKRIIDAGGHVTGDDCPRVDGNLAVSRGFADFQYKSSTKLTPGQQKVSCVPELYEMRDMEKGDLVILACDGIFDVLSNEELVGLVVQSLSAAPPKEDCHDVIGKTCSDVLSVCMKKGSQDNMTCMIVQVGDLDYVKLGQDPSTDSVPVKKAILEQELNLPAVEKLKVHLEDASIKKSYNVFVEQCQKDGCDVSNVANIDMIMDSTKDEKREASSNMAAMSQKERLQKKLEDRKKGNPPSPEKPPPSPEKPSPKAKAASQPTPPKDVEEASPPKKADSPSKKAQKAPPVVVPEPVVEAEPEDTGDADGAATGGKKKKNKNKKK